MEKLLISVIQTLIRTLCWGLVIWFVTDWETWKTIPLPTLNWLQSLTVAFLLDMIVPQKEIAA